MCLTVPELELDVILIANRGDTPVQPLGFQVIDACLEGLAKPAKAKTGAIPAGLFWCDDTAAPLEVLEEEDGQVAAKLWDAKVPMRRDGEGRIIGDLSIVDLVVAAVEGDPDAVTADFRGSCDLYRRLVPGTDDPLAEAIRLIGTYRCDEADAKALVAVDGDCVTVRMAGAFGRDTYDLRRISPLIWTSHLGETGYGGSLEFLAGKDGAITGFAVTTARTKRLRFERVL